MNEYNKRVKNLGLDSRLNKLKEELFELGQAVCHYRDKKIPLMELIEEMADVNILLNQILTLTKSHDLFSAVIEIKIQKFMDKTK